MKILIIAPDFYPTNGGYANGIRSFVEYLLKFNAEIKVDVLTFVKLNGKEELRIKNLNVYRMNNLFDFGKGFNFIFNEIRLIKRIKSLDKENGYDFVMFETAEYSLAGWMLLKSKDFLKKTFVRVHAAAETEWIVYGQDVKYRIKGFFTRRFFEKIQTITSTNKYHLKFVMDKFLDNNPLKYGEKLFFVIPTLSIYYGKEKEKLTIFKDINKYYSFLTLGRMDHSGCVQKNFFRILESISYLKDKEYYKNLLFIFVGKGDFKKKLEDFSRNLKIDDRIKFFDFIEDEELHFLQKNVDCDVLVSIYEGLSFFAIESLKNNACLLVSDTGGIRDLVENGKNGYIVDPTDSKDIADKIDSVIRNLLPNIKDARRNSKRLYGEKFDPEKNIKSFIRFLNIIESYKNVKN